MPITGGVRVGIPTGTPRERALDEGRVGRSTTLPPSLPGGLQPRGEGSRLTAAQSSMHRPRAATLPTQAEHRQPSMHASARDADMPKTGGKDDDLAKFEQMATEWAQSIMMQQMEEMKTAVQDVLEKKEDEDEPEED